MIYRDFTVVLGFVQSVYGFGFFCPTLHPSFSSLFWGFISNCTHFLMGVVGEEVPWPFISSFKSRMSPFENVKFPLNAKKTTWYFICQAFSVWSAACLE